MAWSAPMTAVANTAFTAAQFNQYVRDNLNETVPAKVTEEGQYPVGSGTNAIAMRRAQAASALATINTSSTTYASVTGPSVTLNTGTTVLVFLYAQFTINTNSESAYFSVEISGASSISALDTRALTVGRYTTQWLMGATLANYVTGLTAGSNTVSGMVRVSNGAAIGTYDNRRVIAVPF